MSMGHSSSKPFEDPFEDETTKTVRNCAGSSQDEHRNHKLQFTQKEISELPNDVLLIILKFCSAADIIGFTEAYPTERVEMVAGDKSLWKDVTVDLKNIQKYVKFLGQHTLKITLHGIFQVFMEAQMRCILEDLGVLRDWHGLYRAYSQQRDRDKRLENQIIRGEKLVKNSVMLGSIHGKVPSSGRSDTRQDDTRQKDVGSKVDPPPGLSYEEYNYKEYKFEIGIHGKIRSSGRSDTRQDDTRQKDDESKVDPPPGLSYKEYKEYKFAIGIHGRVLPKNPVDKMMQSSPKTTVTTDLGTRSVRESIQKLQRNAPSATIFLQVSQIQPASSSRGEDRYSASNAGVKQDPPAGLSYEEFKQFCRNRSVCLQNDQNLQHFKKV